MAIERRTNENREQHSPGIYLGKVVNHLDNRFMGGIEVEILKSTDSGNLTEYVQCKYASPFYGQTPYSGLTRNSGYTNTQKSYGFWAVPPDIGVQVIVVMPEGDYRQAYWIACVPDTGMNFMTPGNAGTTYNVESPDRPLPVGEYNKRATEFQGQDVTQIPKPVNTEAQQRLERAGLDRDWIRGTNTSSARREAPSMVFGWSTPGPPDRSGPTHRYGPEGEGQVNMPFNRLGGSSFVMDDGDMALLRTGYATEMAPDYVQPESGAFNGDPKLPANELVRIQTRTGHQILLHNTEDLIYIAHGSGDAWIEMTGRGKIDVYSKDSISIRSEADINITAERDINMLANRNINMTAQQDYKLFVAENRHVRSKNEKVWVEEDSHHKIGKTYFREQENFEIHADQDGKLTVLANLDIVAEDSMKVKNRTLDMNSESEVSITSNSSNINMKANGGYFNATASTTADLKAPTVNIYGTNNVLVTGVSTAKMYGGGAGHDYASGTITSSPNGSTGFVQPGGSPQDAQTAGIAVEADRAEEAEKALLPKRLPAHEPWGGHETLDPTLEWEAEREADSEDEEQEALVLGPITDTFSRPT